MAAPAVAQAPLRVPPGEEEDEEGPGDLVLASEQQRILWDSIQQQDREQRQQRQVGSGGASAASGGSTQRRTTAPPGARTTAPPGAPMSLPFGLLHCKDARAVGAPPRCVRLLSLLHPLANGAHALQALHLLPLPVRLPPTRLPPSTDYPPRPLQKLRSPATPALQAGGARHAGRAHG